MAVNPYADDLGGREALAAMTASLDEVQTLLEHAPAEVFERPLGPGKWTVAQVLLHLLHTELAFAGRARLALTTPGYVVQPFDQDAWMAIEGQVSGPTALEAWVTLRRVNLAFFRRLSPEQRGHPFEHPEHGAVTVEWLLEYLAGHDRRHLGQLRAMLA
jgi:uncharacterized damage-inducible protein DinB